MLQSFLLVHLKSSFLAANLDILAPASHFGHTSLYACVGGGASHVLAPIPGTWDTDQEARDSGPCPVQWGGVEASNSGILPHGIWTCAPQEMSVSIMSENQATYLEASLYSSRLSTTSRAFKATQLESQDQGDLASYC